MVSTILAGTCALPLDGLLIHLVSVPTPSPLCISIDISDDLSATGVLRDSVVMVNAVSFATPLLQPMDTSSAT